jgi:molybdenum cofactor cytidylyltransferase
MLTETIAIVILAAGGSQRMGRPKQLLPFRGYTLLRRAVETAIASQCRPIVVTTGAHEDLIRLELHSLPVLIAHNPDWMQGMSSSLRIAIDTLAEASDSNLGGVVIMLADQPLVTADDIDKIVDVQHRSGKDIVASEYADTHGVPMFVSKRLFPDILRLSGKEGAKRLISDHLESLETVPLLSAAFDIDTPADYKRLFTCVSRHRF